MAARQRLASLLPLLAPPLFVLLWSTGFIGAKYALPDAPPFTLLLLRFALSAALLAALSMALDSHWPRGWARWGHAATVGLLVHAGYLSGVFLALHFGLPAGVTSLVVGLQPPLTALLALPLLGERLAGRQWLGLGLGFLGVALVVLGQTGGGHVGLPALLAVLFALACTTAGGLYQRRFGADVPLLSGTAIQYAVSALALLPLALQEPGRVHLSLTFGLALAWLVLGLSVGAVLIMFWLLRRAPASQVSSLMYLVPPLTALEAYLLFGERLGVAGVCGMALAVVGVSLSAAGLSRPRPVALGGDPAS